MAIILFDNNLRNQFLPLTATRAIADLRFGLFTIKERWGHLTNKNVFIHTEAYLQPLYPLCNEEDNIWIDSSVIVNNELVQFILNLKIDEGLVDEIGLIAGRSANNQLQFSNINSTAWFSILTKYEVARIAFPHQIINYNDRFLREDFKFATSNKVKQTLLPSPTNNLINKDQIFIEEGVTMEYCTVNANTGPVYIAKGATIMEGCLIRGPFYLGENSMLKMGTKIYGATTLGNNCVGGGEIKNVIMQGYSNKAHDGYLGDSIIGEWCNFGAGSSNSNVKNTGGEVHIWNNGKNEFMNAGLKCGVIMGDYSRVAINSSINTGSVIGVCCNVFGKGLLPKVIGHFSWGENKNYEFEKGLKDIKNWKLMKGKTINNVEIEILKHIFETSTIN